MTELYEARGPGAPTHPGEILREDTIPALGWTRQKFADHIGVSRQTVQLVLAEKRPITPDLALRLEKAFGPSAQMWLSMQAAHDLATLRRERQDTLASIETVQAEAIAT